MTSVVIYSFPCSRLQLVFAEQSSRACQTNRRTFQAPPGNSPAPRTPANAACLSNQHGNVSNGFRVQMSPSQRVQAYPDGATSLRVAPLAVRRLLQRSYPLAPPLRAYEIQQVGFRARVRRVHQLPRPERLFLPHNHLSTNVEITFACSQSIHISRIFE